MLKIDPKTLGEWRQIGIKQVTVEFITAGCDGTEIRIIPGSMPHYTAIQIHDSDILLFVEPSKKEVLEHAYISQVKGKWLLSSDTILTRCGCGKSFSLKSGNMRNDKIRLLKSKLAKKSLHTL